MVSTSAAPAGSAKLTLEGLQHWQIRLERDVAQLATHIESTEAMIEAQCGCDASMAPAVVELKQLRDQKARDLGTVEASIKSIKNDLVHAASVAQSTIIAGRDATAPMILLPRAVGHPSTGALLQSSISPPLLPTKTPAKGGAGPSANTREFSRNVARQSSILVNSPDPVTKQLIF